VLPSFLVSSYEIKANEGIGGDAIQETDPDRAQLIKGFQAQFWFSFGSALLGALGALTLRIGRRGTAEEKNARREQDRLQAMADNAEQIPTTDQAPIPLEEKIVGKSP
jgi:hypothetical protein